METNRCAFFPRVDFVDLCLSAAINQATLDLMNENIYPQEGIMISTQTNKHYTDVKHSSAKHTQENNNRPTTTNKTKSIVNAVMMNTFS
jgi:hypothetical protein